MRKHICAQEIAVARAARTGLWHGALRDHAAACSACNESVIAGTAMRSLATDGDVSARLDAAWLWRKALLDHKQAEADRKLRFLDVVQWVSMPAGIVALAGLFGWGWTYLDGYLRTSSQAVLWWRLSDVWLSLALARTQASPESVSWVLLLTLAALFAVHPLLAEE